MMSFIICTLYFFVLSLILNEKVVCTKSKPYQKEDKKQILDTIIRNDVFVINLDRRPERFVYISDQLIELGLNFFRLSAVDSIKLRHLDGIIPPKLFEIPDKIWHKAQSALPLSNAYGCLGKWISHMKAINRIILQKSHSSLDTPVLILEDDAILEKHLPHLINNIIKSLPFSWEILDLTAAFNHTCVSDTIENQTKYGFCQSNGIGAATYGYVVRNSSTAEKILRLNSRDMNKALNPDHIWQHLVVQGYLEAYGSQPHRLVGHFGLFESDMFGGLSNLSHIELSVSNPVLNKDPISIITMSNSTDNNDYTVLQCIQKYGQRDYLPPSKWRVPPMMYSFQGSGNHLCRFLLEAGTGVLVGSVFYPDREIVRSFPGEVSCDWTVSAVLTHPYWLSFYDMTNHKHREFQANGKCRKGKGEILEFKRAILLIRNPYDAIWSEFERLSTGSHVGTISKKDFDWNIWGKKALLLARIYNHTVGFEYHKLRQSFKPEDYIVIYFENLSNQQTRLQQVIRLVNFTQLQLDMGRAHCASLLAEHGKTHRLSDRSKIMQKKDVYTPELICEMWKIFGPIATQHGYSIWNNQDCTKTESVPKIWTSSGSVASVYSSIPSNGQLPEFNANRPVNTRHQLLKPLFDTRKENK